MRGVRRRIWWGVSGDAHAVLTTTCVLTATSLIDTAYDIPSLEYHQAIPQITGLSPDMYMYMFIIMYTHACTCLSMCTMKPVLKALYNIMNVYTCTCT